MSQARPNCGRIPPADLPRLALYPGDVLIELAPNGVKMLSEHKDAALMVPKEAVNRTERSSRCGTVVKVGESACVNVGDFVWFNRKAAKTFSAQHPDERGTLIYLLVSERIHLDSQQEKMAASMTQAQYDNFFVPVIYARKPSNGAVEPVGRTLLVKRDESPDNAGAIIIPEQKKCRAYTGTVVALGQGLVNGVAIGDRVLFNAFSGNELAAAGADVLALAEADVEAVMVNANGAQ